MREAGAGKERQLLAAHEGVEAVDRRDAGLDELRGMFAGVRIDGGPLNLHAFLGDDRRPAVRGFPRSREDAAEHLAGHAELDRLSEELHARRAVDPCGPFEDLDNDDARGRIKDLASLPAAIPELDFDEFVVSHGVCLLDEDQGPGDFADRPVLLRHQRASSFLKSSSITVRDFSSS